MSSAGFRVQRGRCLVWPPCHRHIEPPDISWIEAADSWKARIHIASSSVRGFEQDRGKRVNNRLIDPDNATVMRKFLLSASIAAEGAVEAASVTAFQEGHASCVGNAGLYRIGRSGPSDVDRAGVPCGPALPLPVTRSGRQKYPRHPRTAETAGTTPILISGAAGRRGSLTSPCQALSRRADRRRAF